METPQLGAELELSGLAVIPDLLAFCVNNSYLVVIRRAMPGEPSKYRLEPFPECYARHDAKWDRVGADPEKSMIPTAFLRIQTVRRAR